MAQDKNCMNWAFVEYATRGVWRWGPADFFVAWAQNHSQLVRGHSLVWGAHLPRWLLDGNLSRAELVTAVNSSISTMVRRYRGQVYAWHAVMEPFGDPHWGHPVWNSNLLFETLGPAYLELVFSIARAADPGAKLCLLDYQIAWGMYSGGVWDHAKADLMYGLVRDFKGNSSSSLSRTLDCVCMETHLAPTVAANQSGYVWLRTNFDRYHALGVEVHLNAVTISVEGFDATWTMEQKFQAQATWYAVLLRACVDSPACTDFESYGLSDKYDMGTTSIYSLPFSVDFEPKPAFFSMLEVLNRSSSSLSGRWS